MKEVKNTVSEETKQKEEIKVYIIEEIFLFYGWDGPFFWSSEEYLKVIAFNKKNLRDKYSSSAYFIDQLCFGICLILEADIEKGITHLNNALRINTSTECAIDFSWIVENKKMIIDHLKNLHEKHQNYKD